jgi:hypothetical protein
VTPFTVTVEAVDALGRTVSGSATALLDDQPPPRRSGITQTIEVDAGRLLAFAELVERHAAAIRHDLERFMTGEREDPPGRM